VELAEGAGLAPGSDCITPDLAAQMRSGLKSMDGVISEKKTGSRPRSGSIRYRDLSQAGATISGAGKNCRPPPNGR